MLLPLQNFTELVQGMSAGLQGGSAQLIDVSVGSVTRALIESCGSVALWMQWLIVQVLSATRASTSVGADLDSWMADFSFTRLTGATSTGVVTFSRYTAGMSTSVPVGTVVKTTDGTQTFLVVADAGNAAWDGASSYSLTAASLSIDVLVEAAIPGSGGNVQAGAVGLIGSALSSIDRVVNANAFAGGSDAESDTAFRLRFQSYINSRSLATRGAVETVLMNFRQGLKYAILENVDLIGRSFPGNFCVIIDGGDNSTISDELITEVSVAIDVVRPLGTTFSVTRPLMITADISISLLIASGTGNISVVTQQISEAIAVWVGDLPMAGTLAISKLESLAHITSDAVVSVTLALINGSEADLVAPTGSIIVVDNIDVKTV